MFFVTTSIVRPGQAAADPELALRLVRVVGTDCRHPVVRGR